MFVFFFSSPHVRDLSHHILTEEARTGGERKTQEMSGYRTEDLSKVGEGGLERD